MKNELINELYQVFQMNYILKPVVRMNSKKMNCLICHHVLQNQLQIIQVQNEKIISCMQC